MIIDVDRKDLVSLIKGTDPTFEQMEIPAIAENGWFSGSYGTWHWTGNFKELNEQELLSLYFEIKETGFQ